MVKCTYCRAEFQQEKYAILKCRKHYSMPCICLNQSSDFSYGCGDDWAGGVAMDVGWAVSVGIALSMDLAKLWVWLCYRYR